MGCWAKVIQLGGLDPVNSQLDFFRFWMQQLLCVDKGQPKQNVSLLILLSLCFWSQTLRPFCQDATEGALQTGQSIESNIIFGHYVTQTFRLGSCRPFFIWRGCKYLHFIATLGPIFKEGSI